MNSFFNLESQYFLWESVVSGIESQYMIYGLEDKKVMGTDKNLTGDV